MSESVLAVLGSLAVVAAVWLLIALPDAIDAALARLRGRRSGCADCGGALDGAGTTCATCRDIRRQRLAGEGTGPRAEAPGGDNGP